MATPEQISRLCAQITVEKDGPEFDRLLMELSNAIDLYRATTDTGDEKAAAAD